MFSRWVWGLSVHVWYSDFRHSCISKWLVVYSETEQSLGLGSKYLVYTWYYWLKSFRDHSEVIRCISDFCNFQNREHGLTQVVTFQGHLRLYPKVQSSKQLNAEGHFMTKWFLDQEHKTRVHILDVSTGVPLHTHFQLFCSIQYGK